MTERSCMCYRCCKVSRDIFVLVDFNLVADTLMLFAEMS